mmetsp:Transcript_11088/g.29375  ORF Transcript_11088/g.29375 Transcript_11088/m.29375 type:complete len:244 (-) Transcript_11088:1756-2487(-)
MQELSPTAAWYRAMPPPRVHLLLLGLSGVALARCTDQWHGAKTQSAGRWNFLGVNALQNLHRKPGWSNVGARAAMRRKDVLLQRDRMVKTTRIAVHRVPELGRGSGIELSSCVYARRLNDNLRAVTCGDAILACARNQHASLCSMCGDPRLRASGRHLSGRSKVEDPWLQKPELPMLHDEFHRLRPLEVAPEHVYVVRDTCVQRRHGLLKRWELCCPRSLGDVLRRSPFQGAFHRKFQRRAGT